VFLNRANDPDRIWGAPEQAARDLLRMWLKDFLLVSALARILQYSQSDRKTFSVVPWRRLNVSFFVSGLRSMWPVLVVQSVIVAYYSVVLGPTYYLFFYVFPIVTLYPAVIRLRTTVEHSFDVGFSPKAAEDYWVTRSTRGTVMERFLFSPLGIHHHFEHHLFPSIPHHNLTKVHQLLMESSFPIPIVPSYIGFVIGKIRAELALRQSVPR